MGLRKIFSCDKCRVEVEGTLNIQGWREVTIDFGQYNNKVDYLFCCPCAKSLGLVDANPRDIIYRKPLEAELFDVISKVVEEKLEEVNNG